MKKEKTNRSDRLLFLLLFVTSEMLWVPLAFLALEKVKIFIILCIIFAILNAMLWIVFLERRKRAVIGFGLLELLQGAMAIVILALKGFL